jgi:hypothetical protein
MIMCDVDHASDLSCLSLFELAPPHEAVSTTWTVFDDNVGISIYHFESCHALLNCTPWLY